MESVAGEDQEEVPALLSTDCEEERARNWKLQLSVSGTVQGRLGEVSLFIVQWTV